MDLSFHHCAINVSDLDRSVKFYEEVLGFKQGYYFESSNKLTKIQYMRKGNFSFELTSRGIQLNSFQRRIDEARIKHVAFCINDIKSYHSLLSDRGVEISEIKQKNIGKALIEYFFITDPDGIELELVQITDD